MTLSRLLAALAGAASVEIERMALVGSVRPRTRGVPVAGGRRR